jgi:hypothetical protein
VLGLNNTLDTRFNASIISDIVSDMFIHHKQSSYYEYYNILRVIQEAAVLSIVDTMYSVHVAS